MKGTLFSADFIEDLNGDLRLLEINTDTQSATTTLQYFDYSGFVTFLQEQNITKVVVIHKPRIHEEMVNHLSAALNAGAPFITSFTEIKEGPNVIYPTVVQDETDTFILRLAYDEASIFDSEYAKETLNLFTLFADAGESNSIPEFYHSSTTYGEHNTLTANYNPSNLPDFVLKSAGSVNKFAEFYKVGSESEVDTNESRLTSFLNQNGNSDIYIEKYHIDTETISNNKVSSIRSYSIVYGANLDLIHLAQFKISSVLELPTVEIYDQTKYTNKIDSKHYYEFATNIVKYNGACEGLLNTHLIVKADNSEVEANNLVVGDELKSFYVDGTFLDEIDFNMNNWGVSGSTLPSGSYMTSSVLMYKNTVNIDDKTLSNIVVNNNEDSLFVSPIKSFLVYDSIQDNMVWKMAIDIVSNTDYLIDYDGSNAIVTSNEIFIMNENDFTFIELDVEETDTYIIAGSTPINSFVTHNAPCFVAGTKVKLSDGSEKNIEDVIEGDIVSTFDIKTQTIKFNVVKSVYSKKVDKIVKYTFENGEVLECTLDHPIYVVNKGWSSYSDELSNQMYSIEETVKKIEIDDIVKLYENNTKIINIEINEQNTVVYNLQDIENNHNFFANNVLVHNRFCFIAGTQITMADGSFKNIEEVQIGDEVITLNEETKLNEVKKVINTKSPIHNDLVKYTLSNGIEVTSTFDHPFYVNKMELASHAPNLTNERYQLGVTVRKIETGDFVYMIPKDNGIGMHEVAIEKIEPQPLVDTQTYIFTVEDNHNFYANGILTHNKL